MAQVFLATMKGSGVTKLAVLKCIRPDLAADPEFVGLFLAEARLSARMSHPHVVQVYDVGEEGDRLTITMEYLHGQALARVLRRLGAPSALPLPLRLRIVVDVLSGLDYAHRLSDYDGTPLGVVHRDVSPQNVLITYDGHVKLVDFGIADTLTGFLETRSGGLRGRLAYMAPDPLLGMPVDCRSDIFSVGVMLWEMLEGRRMWQGKTEPMIIHHLSSGRPMPRLRSDLGLPEGLERICRRALAMDPADRFPTAAAMESEIERILPAVSDSQSRHLGKIVSFAFASERAQREELIDQHLRLDQHLRHRAAGSGPWPQVIFSADGRGSVPTHNDCAFENDNADRDRAQHSDERDQPDDDEDATTSINLDLFLPPHIASGPARRALAPLPSPAPAANHTHRRLHKSGSLIAVACIACVIAVAALAFSWRSRGPVGGHTAVQVAAPRFQAAELSQTLNTSSIAPPPTSPQTPAQETPAQSNEPIAAKGAPVVPSGPILEPVVTPLPLAEVAAAAQEGTTRNAVSRERETTRRGARRREERDLDLIASTLSPNELPRLPATKTLESVDREPAAGETERAPTSGRKRMIDTADPFSQPYSDPFAP